jgi:hypothetical protein
VLAALGAARGPAEESTSSKTQDTSYFIFSCLRLQPLSLFEVNRHESDRDERLLRYLGYNSSCETLELVALREHDRPLAPVAVLSGFPDDPECRCLGLVSALSGEDHFTYTRSATSAGQGTYMMPELTRWGARTFAT